MGSNVADIAVEAKNTSAAAVACPVSFPQNVVEGRLDRCIDEYRQPTQLQMLSGRQRYRLISATSPPVCVKQATRASDEAADKLIAVYHKGRR